MPSDSVPVKAPSTVGTSGQPDARVEVAMTSAAVQGNSAVPGSWIPRVMVSGGLKPTLPVLSAPDYVREQERVQATSWIWKELSKELPEWDVRLALAEGPFEDDDGVGAFFDLSRRGLPPQKKILYVRRDFLTSVVKLMRAVELHKP